MFSVTTRASQVLVISIMSILSIEGVRCGFTPIRGRQVKAGTLSPLYPTQSPPPAGFLVWLDYLEKSEASNNSSEFAQFWKSVESVVIPLFTSEAVTQDDMNQENGLSLNPESNSSEQFANSSMIYRHPVMVAGIEVGLLNSDVLSACSWATKDTVGAANSVEEGLDYDSMPIQSICQLRLDIDREWPSAQLEVFLRLEHSKLVNSLLKTMPSMKDPNFDDTKGPSSSAWASQQTCHWEAYYYSHDGFERVAEYGSEGNLKYVYGGVDLEDDGGNFTESDWSSLPISGQTLMVEVVLRGKDCDLDTVSMNANQDLLPSIRLVDTVVSNASALQPRLVGTDSKDILTSLKSQWKSGEEGSIGNKEESAMQTSGGTTAFCNSAACHKDVTCEESFLEERNGVVKLFLGTKVCSGTLIADPESSRLLVLTAQHCLPSDSSPSAATYWKAVFLFERQCNSLCETPSAVVYQGLKVLWTSITSDTALLRFIGNDLSLANEFSQNGIYYNGWDRSTVDNPASASCIHHPVGDVKKITVDNTFTMSEKELLYTSYTMYNWEVGTIQPGSSGSPLFSGNSNRVIGVLSGVDSCTYFNACGYQENECKVVFALFPKLSAAWDGPTGLSSILSPSNPDLMSMGGSSLYFGEPAYEEPDTLPFEGPLSESDCPQTLTHPPGDIDYSGNVDINDLIIILANLTHDQDPNKSQVLSNAGIKALSECEMKSLDLDGDGKTNIVDYAQLTVCVQNLVQPCQ